VVGILVTEQSLEKTLRHILELACAALPGGDEGGITLLGAEGPGIAIATSDVARRIDCSQYDAGTGGPCLDAYRRHQVLRIDSTASDQRWPEFSGPAAAEGIASTLSIPLVVSGDALGGLNIYCYREYGFPAADERLAVALGDCASVALDSCAATRSYFAGRRGGHGRASRPALLAEQGPSCRAVPLGHDDDGEGHVDYGSAVVHQLGAEVPGRGGPGAERQVAGVHELAQGVVAGRGNDQGDQPAAEGRPAADRVGADERPAEQAARREQVEVDGGVNQVVALGGGVQVRQVQRVEAAKVGGDREGRRDDEPGRAAVQ
jgi:hypothetical protein